MSITIPGQRQSVENVLSVDDWQLVSLMDCGLDEQARLYVAAQRSLVESGQAGVRGMSEREARNRLSWVQDDIQAGEAVGYAIQTAADQRSVGEVIVTWLTGNAEIEYFLVPGARGRGIARQAVGMVLHRVFGSYPIDNVVFEIRRDNTPSQHVAEAVGAVRQPASDSAQYETWRVYRG